MPAYTISLQTAYFVIPENVRHGEELICSYFACRNAGVKFRYCSHCKVPVAKRNFRKRHRHGDSDKSKGIVDDDDESEEGSRPGENADDIDDIPTQVTAKIPPEEAAKMPAKSSPLEDAPRSQQINHSQLSAQQRAAKQQLGAHQFGAGQQLSVPQLGTTQVQQSPLQQLSAQQKSALQQLNVHQHHALQQHLGVQQQLGNQQQGNSPQIAFQQQLGGQKPQQLNSEALAMNFTGRPGAGTVHGSIGLQMETLLGKARNTLGKLPHGTASEREASLQISLAGASSTSDEKFMLPSQEKSETMLLERKDKWLQLLAERPYTTNGDTMSAWLMEILTVSDLTLSLGNTPDLSKTEPKTTSMKMSPEDRPNGNVEEDDEDVDEEQNGDDDDDDDGENEAATADEDEDNKGGLAAGDGEDTRASGEGDGGSVEDCARDKKRFLAESSPSGEAKQGGDTGYSGSFAEWRDRKKQKKGFSKSG